MRWKHLLTLQLKITKQKRDNRIMIAVMNVSWWYESSHDNVMAKTQTWDNASMDPVISKLVTEASLVIIQEPYCYQEGSNIKTVCDLTLLPQRRLPWCMLMGTHLCSVAALAPRNEDEVWVPASALLSLAVWLGWFTLIPATLGFTVFLCRMSALNSMTSEISCSYVCDN